MTQSEHGHSWQALQQDIGEAFDTFFEKIGKHHHAISGQVATGYRPATDVRRKKSGLDIALELPGMDKADLEIVVEDGVLTVRGEKSRARERKGRTYILQERQFGRFERSFSLPESLDAEKAEASFERGVLKLHVPLKAGAERAAKRIAIKGR